MKAGFSFYSFYKTSYGRFCIFRIVILVVSCEQKHKINKAGFQFVGWCMMNIVSKNYTQIRITERGMANLHLWQLLGWPSSYGFRDRQRFELVPKITRKKMCKALSGQIKAVFARIREQHTRGRTSLIGLARCEQE